MSSPALLRRNLTVNFDRAINFTSQRPEVVDVVVIPLSVPSDAASTANVTLVGGLQSQKIVLSDAVNSAVFQLVPSNEPGLTEPVNYRIAWRQGIVGRTFVTDFAMPDADISFDQLADLGHIIGGETYLQQADLGVPGRVARLNSEGQVVDSSGTPVAGQADISTLQGLLNVEIVNRGRADVSNRVALENELTTQINATLSTAKAYSDAIDASLNTTMASESNSRQAGDTTLGGQISALQTALNGLSSTVGSHTTTLTEKADLDGSGHIPLGEIPAAAITNWVPVADINAMLALRYPQDVQPGDIALVGAGPLIYGLAGVTPSQLNNWILLNRVTSVNGQGGDVELTAADVGAVAATGGMVAMDQVTGLATALGTKATESDLTALTSTVSGILGDTTIVHTVGGVIPHTLNDANMAFINDANEITKKDGTVLEVGGSAVESVNGHTGIVSLTYTDVGALATNGDVAMDHVTGLITALSTLVDTTDARLSDARTPAAHASSHGVGQADAVTVAQSQVTGLPTLLTNNGLTTISNAVGRIYSLETLVTGLTGGSGGPAGATEFWQSVSPTGDFASDVTFHSPFGYNPTNVAANADGYYLDSAGAASGEAVWPYLHSTGHLELRPWNPSASPDPAYATESDFTTLSTTVAGKADSSALSSLASSASVSSLSSTVSSLSTSVTNKADQSALDTTNATVATLATEAEVTTLTSTVGAKANSSDLATTNGNVAALVTAMTSKASLDGGGHVPVAQLPNFAISQTTGLATALAGKADVVSGTVPLAQLPMIPGSTQVTGWNTKADLVGGLIPSNQIPSIALTNTQVVANRAAMLALTTSQVQLGDLCIITATADQGSYVLNSSDPSQFSNWVELATPLAPVSSVNGQTGTVVLAWGDVGALAANAAIPISQVSNLQTTLNGLATTTALNSAIAGATTPSQVQAMLSSSVETKRADYVANSAVASLSGQQSVDGVLMPVGAIVLLTAQASSVTNGSWVVNSGPWTRATDFTTGSWLVTGSLVLVSNKTASANGAARNNTFWRMTATSGVVDTNANNWSNVMTAGPPLVYTQGNGIAISNQQVSAVVAPNGGCQLTSSGIGIDTTSVVRKFVTAVPGGSPIVTITHGLGTTSPIVGLIHVASGDIQLIGPTVTGANTISLEFQSAPATGQWRAIVMG